MSLLDLSRPWVHRGAPVLAQRAVSTLGDSSTSRLKHYRALQINHEVLCQQRKKTQQQQASLLSAEWSEREGGALQCCDEGAEKEREQDDERHEGEEGRQKVKGREKGGGYSVDAFILPS